MKTEELAVPSHSEACVYIHVDMYMVVAGGMNKLQFSICPAALLVKTESVLNNETGIAAHSGNTILLLINAATVLAHVHLVKV